MQKGDKVTYLSYGQVKTGTVDSLNRSGNMVFIAPTRERGGRILHRESILSVNGKPMNGSKAR